MKEEQRSIFWQIFLPVSCACIVIMLMLFGFSNKIRTDAVETCEKDMIEVAESYSQKIQSDLQITYAVGVTVARIMEKQTGENADNVDIIRQSLNELVNQTELYAAEYFMADGRLLNQEGLETDLAEREFLSTLNEQKQEQYVYLKKEDGVGEDTILIVIPNEQTEGALYLYYPVKRLKSLSKVNREFDQTAFSVIVTGEGEILQAGDMKSNFLLKSNLMDNIDKKYYGELMGVKVKLQNKTSGCVKLSAGDEDRTLIYAPLNINDWILVLGVNQKYVNLKENQMWNQTCQMLYQFLAVIILCIFVLVVVNVMGKVRNVEKSRLLLEKVDTDQLTGLNNKLATERKIIEYLRGNQDTMAVMFILDIDNFKKINDTMGHAFGDEVLRTLGKQISSNFRVTDIIGRTGGDEFIVFLKNLKDEESIQREAGKLINFFKSFQVGEYVKYSATASIGAAVFPADGQTFESLYKSADSALYRAKKRGKNQLAFFDDRDLSV